MPSAASPVCSVSRRFGFACCGCCRTTCCSHNDTHVPYEHGTTGQPWVSSAWHLSSFNPIHSWSHMVTESRERRREQLGGSLAPLLVVSLILSLLVYCLVRAIGWVIAGFAAS